MAIIDGLWKVKGGKGVLDQSRELRINVDGLCGEGLELGREACESAPYREGEQTFVVEGHETANELAKQGAGANGGQMAAARALTIKQFRKGLYASMGVCCAFSCAGRRVDRQR